MSLNLSESSFHTLLTQGLALASAVVAFIHPGTNGFTVPDSVVVAFATVAAGVASGLHTIGSSKAKVVTNTATVEAPKNDPVLPVAQPVEPDLAQRIASAVTQAMATPVAPGTATDVRQVP